MHRFFAAPNDIFGGMVRLSNENMNHIRVLRLRPAELFVICDGAGLDHVCRLVSQGDSAAEIIETRPSQGEPSISCSIYLALAKGDSLDYSVQKSVELGAKDIILFPSARSIAISADMTKKTARLQRIALEAAKQSGRGAIPGVSAMNSYEEAVRHAASAGLPLFLYEDEKELRLKEVLESHADAQTVSIFIGPEGGFDPFEAETAKSAGMLSVTLGSRILRCETAPVAALAAIMYHTDNI